MEFQSQLVMTWAALMTGLGALLLPFAYGTPPRDATFDGELWPLAVPFYLALLIGLASLRMLKRLRPRERESWLEQQANTVSAKDDMARDLVFRGQKLNAGPNTPSTSGCRLGEPLISRRLSENLKAPDRGGCRFWRQRLTHRLSSDYYEILCGKKAGVTSRQSR